MMSESADVYLADMQGLHYFVSLRKARYSLFRDMLVNITKYDEMLESMTFCVVGGDIKLLYGSYEESEIFQLSTKGNYYIINKKFLPKRTEADMIVHKIRFPNGSRMLLKDAMIASFNSNKCWLSFCNLLTNSLFLQIVNIDNQTYLQYLDEAIVDVSNFQIKKHLRNGDRMQISCDCLVSFLRNFSSSVDAGALQQGFWNPLDRSFFSRFPEHFIQNDSSITITSSEISDDLLGLTINSIRGVFRPGDESGKCLIPISAGYLFSEHYLFGIKYSYHTLFILFKLSAFQVYNSLTTVYKSLFKNPNYISIAL